MWRPCVAQEQQGKAHAEQKNAAQAQQPVPPPGTVIKSPVPAPIANAPSKGSQNDAQEKPLPRFIRPEWVIVYITAIYVLVAWRTLRAIKRQGDIMDRQANDARKSGAQTFAVLKEQTDNALISAKAATVSAMAADKSIKAAQRSIDITLLKERARLRIEVDALEVILVGDITWIASVNIKVFNVGAQKAFPSRSHVALVVSESNKRVKAQFPMPFLTQAIIPPSDIPLEHRASTGANDDTIFLLNTEQRFTHLYGEIMYSDFFEKERILRFRYFWRTNGWILAASTVMSGSTDPDGTKALYGEWEKTEEDNEEN